MSFYLSKVSKIQLKLNRVENNAVDQFTELIFVQEDAWSKSVG